MKPSLFPSPLTLFMYAVNSWFNNLEKFIITHFRQIFMYNIKISYYLIEEEKWNWVIIYLQYPHRWGSKISGLEKNFRCMIKMLIWERYHISSSSSQSLIRSRMKILQLFHFNRCFQFYNKQNNLLYKVLS